MIVVNCRFDSQISKQIHQKKRKSKVHVDCYFGILSFRRLVFASQDSLSPLYSSKSKTVIFLFPERTPIFSSLPNSAKPVFVDLRSTKRGGDQKKKTEQYFLFFLLFYSSDKTHQTTAETQKK